MPHFAERDEKTNAFRQQDAHECWSALMSNLAQTLKMDSPQTPEVGAHLSLTHSYPLPGIAPLIHLHVLGSSLLHSIANTPLEP